MKKLTAILAFVFLCAPLFAGTVSTVTGDVDVLVSGTWKSATAGMTISSGTKIMTGIGSSLVVSTTGGSFTVSELSMVTFQETTTSGTSSQNLDLTLGKVKVDFSKAGTDNNFKVTTPKGTASIRGTQEVVQFFPGSGMKVLVLLGHVDVGDLAGNILPAFEGQNIEVVVVGGLAGTDDFIMGFFGEDGFSMDDDITPDEIHDWLDQMMDLIDIQGLLDDNIELELL